MNVLVWLTLFSSVRSTPRADALRPSRGALSDQEIMSALSRLLSEQRKRRTQNGISNWKEQVKGGTAVWRFCIS